MRPIIYIEPVDSPAFSFIVEKRRAKFTVHNKFHNSKMDLIILYRLLNNNEISFSQDLSYKQQKKILSLCKCKEFQKCCLEQIVVERTFDEKRFTLAE